MLRISDYGYPVTYENCVEVESKQLLKAAPQARRVVQHALAQEAQMPGRIPDNRVTDDQGFSLRPKECHFAGTLSADAYHFDHSDPFTSVKFTVQHQALRFRIRCVLRMNVGTGGGA